MASTINASTSGAGGLISTADASGVLELQTAGVTRVTVASSGMFLARTDSAFEGGQLTLNRASDDAASWAFDVYGSTSTPSFRFVDVTAGAERATFDGSGNFAFNSGYGSAAIAYGCRAWVNFNGTGTVAIRASGNVTSITDLGTGAYRVNFTTAMPDANYSVAGGASSSACEAVIRFFTYTTTTLNVSIVDSNTPTFTDDSLISVQVFR